MRTEQQMLELIIGIAKQDARVRAVIMNGSRANPHAPRDIFQDFDIVYLVSDVTSFKDDRQWIDRFGEIMIMQMPEDMGDSPQEADGGFSYLMQFTDGNRIDLWIRPLWSLDEVSRDSLSVLLLDKDEIVRPFAPPNESDYLPKPPTSKAFSDCCNEFWWVCTYVAKGLWRRQMVYARYMLDQIVREQLMKMLTWHIGAKTNFSVDPGSFGKYFQRYLDPDLWLSLEKTYADASYAATWQALFEMCNLFRGVALPLAEQSGFQYPEGDDTRVRAHLEHVMHLPRNAEEMY